MFPSTCLHFGDCLPQNNSISCVSKCLWMTYIYIQVAQPSTGGSRSKGGGQVVLQSDSVYMGRTSGWTAWSWLFPDPSDVVITSMEGLMFSRVCLFVCRLVSRITRKLLNGFPWNSIIYKWVQFDVDPVSGELKLWLSNYRWLTQSYRVWYQNGLHWIKGDCLLLIWS